MKQTAQRVFLETLAAIQIPAVLARKLGRTGSVIHAAGAAIDLRGFREIVGIAFGKASFPMAEALSENLAPEFQVDGILVGPASPPGALAGWKSFVGGHPIPSAGSFAAGRAILETLQKESSNQGFLVISRRAAAALRAGAGRA